ncbi:MAG: hypothetical protein IPM39_22600 [Chloroflexi bacterium]|nr:hypothetical protein [Chloroflexota bacterium]
MWWLTVAAYWGTAVLCLLCVWRFRQGDAPQRRVYTVLAVSMAVLAVNKQFNLIGRLTTQGRFLAWGGDWYAARGGLQWALIGGVLLLMGLGLLLLVRFLRPLPRLQVTAVVGVAFLTGFSLLRAISLHAVDAFLYRGFIGINPNFLLEMGGIALVAIPALLDLTGFREPVRS